LDLSSGTPVWSSATTVESFEDETMWWSEEIGVGIRQSTTDIWVHFPYYFYHDTPQLGLHIDYKIVTMLPDFPSVSLSETHINTEEVKIHPTTDAALRTHYLKSFQNWVGPSFPNTGLVHFYLEEITGWEYYNIFSNFEYQIYSHTNASASSNDVHFIWKDVSAFNPDVLYYMYLDKAPLTPVNFTGQVYNSHPKLIWSLNNEPDINGYEIYRKLTSGSGVFELLTTVSSNTTSYVDREIQLGGGTIGKVFYKIRAKDNHPYYSDYTNQIIYAYSGLNKLSIVNNTFECKLFSNYPNPFNPSTQIKYSLAQDADVTLKVYDMLGTLVAELVNETRAAGNHTINFNAKNLSSGVYIYRITANNNGKILFTDSKQMILMK
jgi:hypothetical protein